MKRILASIISGAAILPLMWWSVAPNGQAYCADEPYTKVQENSLYPDRTATIQYRGSVKFCNVVADFPL